MIGFELRLGRRPKPTPPDQLSIETLPDLPEGVSKTINVDGQFFALECAADISGRITKVYALILGEWAPLEDLSTQLQDRIKPFLAP